MNPIALSTCWNSHRHTDGREMLAEIAALGFNCVELSHGIRISLVPGILAAVEAGEITVGSLHNFCPLPPGVMGAAPNLYLPTSRDLRELRAWVSQTRKTIDLAVRVGARLVVLHGGAIRFWWRDPQSKLDRLIEARQPTDPPPSANPAVQKELATLRQLAEKRLPPHRQNLLLALAEVLPYAVEKKVQLVLENREGLFELPLDWMWTSLFLECREKAAGLQPGYWHDAGHGQRKEFLGVSTQDQLLMDNGEHLLGWHLHDFTAEGKDHQIPGTGLIDWPRLFTHLKPHHHLVLELSPKLSPEEVIQGRDFLLRTLSRIHPAGRL